MGVMMVGLGLVIDISIRNQRRMMLMIIRRV